MQNLIVTIRRLCPALQAETPQSAAFHPDRVNDSASKYDLERTLPYLLNRAGVRMGNSFTGEIQPRFDVPLPLWRILASLLRQNPQRLTELAEHTSTELSTVSRLVSAAVKRGLVSRSRAGDDARSVAISLTDAGRELVLQIVPMAELYERIALSGFEEQEVVQLKEWLRRIFQNISSLGPRGEGNGRARRAVPDAADATSAMGK